MKREDAGSNPCLECLEPRLLLSGSAPLTLEWLNLADVPRFVTTSPAPPPVADDPVSGQLRQAQGQLEDTLAQNPGVVLDQLSGVRVRGNSDFQVYLYVDAVDASTLGALEAAGVQIEISNANMRVVQGWAPAQSLDALARVPGVRAITPPDYGVTRAGSVMTEGDADLNADDLRAIFGGVTGDGIKIGVISDGVDNWGDVAGAPFYDLPDSITVDPTSSGSGDEGTAMLEIIHDIAPDADLYFSSGIVSAAQMVASIDWLVNTCHVDVIVDDLGFYGQPMFEDGTVAHEAADAVAAGVVYVTAAGNDAQTHYQGDYVDSGVLNLHEFNQAGAILMEVQVPEDGTVKGFLQWSDEWGSSGNNYDLWLFATNDYQNWTRVGQSETVQNGNDLPYEGLEYKNEAGYACLGWAIRRTSGATRELEFYTYGDIDTINGSVVTAGDSVFGHAAVESVITVGAISASEPGLNDVEAFSSRGLSTIYNFGTQPPTRTTRYSLDVCGIDYVQTKIGQLGHFSNPFYGTSAAAPHIAGIAALLLQMYPSLSPAGVSQVLTDTAVDLTHYGYGYDAVSGWGRADGLYAAYKLYTPQATDLSADSDLGISATDNLTCDTTPTFVGTVPKGSCVRVFVDGQEAGNQQLDAEETSYSINPFDLPEGTYQVTVRVAADWSTPLENISQTSDALQVTIETTAPTASIVPVTPDPRQTSVSSIAFEFSEAFSGAFTLADLTLKREGVAISWVGTSANLADDGDHHFTLSGIAGLTDKAGRYELVLTAEESGIIDFAGNEMTEDATSYWTMNAINTGAGNDTVKLSMDGTLTKVDINNGATVYWLDPAGFPILNINTGDGNDTLTVDFSAGNPVPAAGLAYDGGDGTDTLKIIGTSGDDELNYTSGQALFNPNSTYATITFTGVEFHEVALGDGEDTLGITNVAITLNSDVGVSATDASDTVNLFGGATVLFGAAQHLKVLNVAGYGCHLAATDRAMLAQVPVTVQEYMDVTFDTSLSLAALNLEAGSKATLAPGGTKVIVTKALTIDEDENDAPTARLDLTDNNLVVDYTGYASPLMQISNWVKSGANFNPLLGEMFWNGPGITSSVAASDPGGWSHQLVALGIRQAVDAGDYGMNQMTSVDSVGINDTSVVVKYTWMGDADLDGTVTIDDYYVLDYYYTYGVSVPGTEGWWTGDLNGDGQMTIDDYYLMDIGYTYQGDPL